MSNIRWFVAHTQPLKENLAMQNLLQQGYEVYLPKFMKTSMHARKVQQKLVPLFPRYIFVGVNTEKLQWRSITGTHGISYLLMTNDSKPAQVPSYVIDELKDQETSNGTVPISCLKTFTKGEKVRIKEGFFKDHIAIFESQDGKERVSLFLSFMGKEMNVKISGHDIDSA